MREDKVGAASIEKTKKIKKIHLSLTGTKSTWIALYAPSTKKHSDCQQWLDVLRGNDAAVHPNRQNKGAVQWFSSVQSVYLLQKLQCNMFTVGLKTSISHLPKRTPTTTALTDKHAIRRCDWFEKPRRFGPVFVRRLDELLQLNH